MMLASWGSGKRWVSMPKMPGVSQAGPPDGGACGEGISNELPKRPNCKRGPQLRQAAYLSHPHYFHKV